MHEFTGEQLHYHAAKASFPANVLAAELLALRKQLEAAHDFNAELNEQVDGMIDDCDTIQAKYDRLREACLRSLSELGVPGPGYPAPVANAVDILNAALAEEESDG